MHVIKTFEYPLYISSVLFSVFASPWSKHVKDYWDHRNDVHILFLQYEHVMKVCEMLPPIIILSFIILTVCLIGKQALIYMYFHTLQELYAFICSIVDKQNHVQKQPVTFLNTK